MVRARAIKKIYATRYGAPTKNVIGYTLEDEQGNLLDVEKEHLKQAIRQRKIEVINMTLTSDDRLVFRNIEKLSENQSNKFKKQVNEAMVRQAEDYEMISCMMYDNTLCEYKPSEKGLILYKVRQKQEKSEFIQVPYLSVPLLLPNKKVDFSMIPDVKIVYHNAFIDISVEQNDDDEPLDYSNVEYIGNYGIPVNSSGEFIRVKFGDNLKYLGYQSNNDIWADYLLINDNLSLYKNKLPEYISIGEMDITRKDCSDIDIQTLGNIGRLNISSRVQKIISRKSDEEQCGKAEGMSLYVEELYISNQSGITKHNSFPYTDLEPDDLYRFNLKVLDVPEEIFDDIVNDSLQGLRYDMFYAVDKKISDIKAIDMIIDNIKQIARAYKVGTGRNLTEQQKKKFIQAIKKFEKMKVRKAKKKA